VTVKNRLIDFARRPWGWVQARFSRGPNTPGDDPRSFRQAPPVQSADGCATFTAFAANSPGLMWIKDESGRYQFVNHLAASVHARPLAQWLGKTDYDIFPAESADQFTHNDRQVIDSAQSLFSTEWVPVRGVVRHMMTSRFPITDRGRKLIGGIAIDISDGVRAMRESAGMRHHMSAGEPAKSIIELSSIIGHDLNNTLNAVMLRLSLFATAALDAEQEANAARIEHLVERAAASVRRLQEFANAQRPFSEATELGEMLQTEVRAFNNANGFPPLTSAVKAVLNLPETLPAVRGNAGEVRYVLGTLLRNAQEAMPHGGTITVEAHANLDRVIVTVADEGIGISGDRLANIFDPFFTTKATLGSGLGLAGSFGIMSRLGGTIAAANRPERGAIFTLDFPVFTDLEVNVKPEHSDPGDSHTADAARQRILVIDDDVDNLEAMKEALEMRGYEVETAPDGKKGLELLRLSPHFDSVICDVGMPIMNGWDVAQEITRVAPATRVYMLTGWANEIPQSDPRRAGVAAVIAKPISVEQIDAAIARKS
jgi:signal transduction histidine kinase/CheY-like chemotaxis protein